MKQITRIRTLKQAFERCIDDAPMIIFKTHCGHSVFLSDCFDRMNHIIQRRSWKDQFYFYVKQKSNLNYSNKKYL